jgi:hypothetical protein
MSSPPERRGPNPPQPVTPIRVSGPSDEQNLRQIFAPVQLLYALSAGIPGHISGGGAGIITSITDNATVDGAIIFSGPGVVQSGQTFNFPATTGAAAITLGASFTIPAVGNSAAMTVAGDYEKLQDLVTLFIANGTTNDQQPYVAQVISGGGTASLVVETVSLGTYAVSGTIANGTTVTWGSTPSVTGLTPSVANYGEAGGTGSTSMPITLSGSPSVGNRMVAYVSCAAGQTMFPPTGWNVLDPQTATASGLLDVVLGSWFRDVEAGDGTTYTWTCTGGGLENGLIQEITGAAVGLMQHSLVYVNSASPSTNSIIPSAPNSFIQALFCVRNSVGFAPSTGWTQTYFVRIATSGLALLAAQSPTNALRSNTTIQGAGTTGDGYCLAAILAFPPAAAAGASGAVGSVAGIVPIVVVGTGANPIVTLQTPLGPSYGGTGLASPGPSLNVLKSTGLAWTSAPETTAAITQINSQTGPAFSIVGSTYIGVSTLTNQAEIINTGIQTVTGPSYTASNTGIVFTGPNVLQTAPNTFYISVAGSAGGGGGGSTPAFPFTVVQDASSVFTTAGGTTSLVITLPQATAASGNTLLLFVATDPSSTVTSTGFTSIVSKSQASFAFVGVFKKATAGESSITVALSVSQFIAAYVCEISGARVLDQSATSGSATPVAQQIPPSITPTAGSAIFCCGAYTPGNVTPSGPLSKNALANGGWIDLSLDNVNGSRALLLMALNNKGTGVGLPMPSFAMPPIFASSGIALASLSIL